MTYITGQASKRFGYSSLSPFCNKIDKPDRANGYYLSDGRKHEVKVRTSSLILNSLLRRVSEIVYVDLKSHPTSQEPFHKATRGHQSPVALNCPGLGIAQDQRCSLLQLECYVQT